MHLSGGYPKNLSSFQYWQEYDAHDVLPFSGGFAEQPLWFVEDVTFFNLLNELEAVKVEMIDCDKQLTQKV